VGSGPNATTLHYNANTRQMLRGDMVVIDIGASFDGYAADMTRAYPVSGTFSPAQRAIYQIVRDAQAAAERQARAGIPTRRMSDSAAAVLAAGLTTLGLIDAPDATYDCGEDGARQCKQLTLFYMHGLSHGIGLDVHDPDQYSYDDRVIGVGSVFTIEPGLYIRSDAFDVLPKTPRNLQLAQRRAAVLARYRNIGVRIEDDYLVTPTGLEWLTKGPREIAEIEQAMKRPRM
jgi:Xaa-Pro aminopeptidase